MAGHENDPMPSVTSTDLLHGLRDPRNGTVWRDFDERYRPLVVRAFRRIGLAEHDADDVAQQTMVAFSTAYRDGKYDRERGRLRSWLFGIAHVQLRAFNRRRGREIPIESPTNETDFIARVPGKDAMQAIWDEEWKDAIVRQCLAIARREVNPQTFEAFELFSTREWPAERVAEHLGMTANAVFSAKRRVLRRIRELMPSIEELW